MKAGRLAAIAAPMMLSACMSMSGLDGNNEFGCKAPPGVTCQSISGVHANAMAENLPFQRKGGVPGKEEDAPAVMQRYGQDGASSKISPKEMVVPMSGMPIRKPPLILRVWVAPYEDEANDLHDQSFFYTMVNPGEWMIEANHANLRKQFRPTLAPVGGVPAPSPDDQQQGTAAQRGQAAAQRSVPSAYGQTPNLPR